MPSLNGCEDGCAALLSTATGRQAATEVNMLQSDIGTRINATAAAFVELGRNAPERAAFFAQRPLSADLSTLAEVGVDVRELQTGAVVTLEPLQIQRARHLPQGLTYWVSCAGMPENEFLILGKPGPTIEGSALVTDCPLVVSQTRDVVRSLVVSIWAGIPGLDLPGIEIMARGSGGGCRRGRTVLMSQQGVLLLPGASGSGLGLVSATHIMIAPASQARRAVRHRGLALHAEQTIAIEGRHQFDACGLPDAEGLLPTLHVIRHVVPENMAAVTAKWGPTVRAPAPKVIPSRPSHSASAGALPVSLP
ncbi:hypothetical protein EYC08_17735 [Tabrizicola sp. WMC-M-20]|nr:hypothetical protein EYC08_17735 [Tabrizicola sp. WMC-M-20]